MIKTQLPLSPEAVAEFAKTHDLYRIGNFDIFADTAEKVYAVAVISDRILPLKSYLDLVRKLQQEEEKQVCVDDEFLAACVMLDLEVSVFSAVYCLKGLSSDFKETKMNRDMIDASSHFSAADLRHKLSKPNEIRGAVESNTIYTSFNRLVRRMHLYKCAEEIMQQLDGGIPKQEIMRNFALTLTDFELVIKIGKHNYNQMNSQRRIEGEQRLRLNNDNLIDLKDYAHNHGINMLNQALNDVLEQFFIQQKVRQQSAAGQTEQTTQSAKNRKSEEA